MLELYWIDQASTQEQKFTTHKFKKTEQYGQMLLPVRMGNTYGARVFMKNSDAVGEETLVEPYTHKYDGGDI